MIGRFAICFGLPGSASITVVVGTDAAQGRTALGSSGVYALPIVPVRLAIGDSASAIKIAIIDQDHLPVSLAGKTADLKLVRATDNVVIRDWSALTVTDSAAGRGEFRLTTGEASAAVTLRVFVRIVDNATLRATVHPPAGSPHHFFVVVG